MFPDKVSKRLILQQEVIVYKSFCLTNKSVYYIKIWQQMYRVNMKMFKREVSLFYIFRHNVYKKKLVIIKNKAQIQNFN